MTVQQENLQAQDLSELVNKVCEELRPLVTEIVTKVVAGSVESTTPKAVEQSPAEEKKEVKIEVANIPEMAEITATLKEIQDKVQDFTYKDGINKKLHEELQKHQSGLRKEFITPLLKHIIREYDRATQQYEFYRKKNEEEPQSELFVKQLKEYNIISLSLLDLLEDYGVTPVHAKTGDNYSPNEHKILQVIETDVEEQNGKIVECVLCGFRDIETGRILRQMEINIFKFK